MSNIMSPGPTVGGRGLPFGDLERIYEMLAKAIDRVGPERETVMLARLVLLLAQDCPDAERIIERIAQALAASANDPATRQL